MQAGAQKGHPICRKTARMNAEQVWMREPLLQCREEFDIYREIFEFVTADLDQIDWKGGVITEGAVYLIEISSRTDETVWHPGKPVYLHFTYRGISDHSL